MTSSIFAPRSLRSMDHSIEITTWYGICRTQLMYEYNVVIHLDVCHLMAKYQAHCMVEMLMKATGLLPLWDILAKILRFIFITRVSEVIMFSPCVFITRDSEVIMFSPCVFVCLFVGVFVVVYVCHDVCPDDLTMKDWCHTNNILQVHCLGCLVVQVMFHALMTSLMTSPDHKVGQILKLIYLRQYYSYSVDQKPKMSEMLMAIFLVHSTSGITSGKKVCRELKMAAILKFFEC